MEIKIILGYNKKDWGEDVKIYIDSSILKSRFNIIAEAYSNHEITDKVDESFDALGIIVYPNYVIKENIEKYKNLKWIQIFSAGFNTIDLDYLRENNIVLTNAKDVYNKPIAEDVITKILTFNRNVNKYYENMKTSLWKRYNNEYELTSSTVGIIGVGSIGLEIAKRLKGFETKIIGYRRKPNKEEYFDEIFTGEEGLNKLLKESDYVVIALPLNKETYGMINLEKLKLMKKESLLINIARGEIVNQDDLIYALENNLIRGAALDVLVSEPLPIDNKLWKMDNVFITPHNSFSSPYTINRLVDLLINNIKRFVNDEKLLNIVDLGGK